MALFGSTTTQTPRLSTADLRARMQAGEPCTLLDARSSKAWDASNVKARGAIRVDPKDVHVDPGWPRNALTVVYCT